ncbi:NACHT domain family protein (plasmid) [Leptolyngbya boryana NIES-2135]|jgi:energy-coupling factor transporter ATP-binding protein EcfA2|uniref:NACHT domain family protein n=1 Tax=Leptolyngbya boryana NIES-2135 TaxID=1973484 RepID=A0A1Z4JS35_LEPBY|nr:MULTISPECIES: NACHT domain-containing NTPase [Leptolyngbya]BAY59532.1 NACHT domain family protein [Leptolyngbya boryana NIES-2135]MBD2371290.1 NACHT domain-containing NTPase [Leptolyngbya sp. FACHB-161]MBD2377768.1 NACHT domain-containing NTPase [Leptolyngbya sp. FACHB-238]MBD2402206.1 NACHT domain-containing NTPase [Leptolyngbya sp. FACHB-239]MBD2408699.1 NACHT domain-containing NTPase [Leptolyngbya sp. FACHB-402]
MGQVDTIQLSEAGQNKLRIAYKSAGFTQEVLADKAYTSVDTVRRVLGTKSCTSGVQRWIVENIAAAVGLTLMDLGISDDSSSHLSANIDILVEDLRKQVREKIYHLCSMMRVLDMAQPLTLNRIYTRVNILESIRCRQRRELRDLLEKISSKDCERFNLGDVVEGQVPGIEAVQKFEKLIILGRPGAGKTTFLKYLAMQCIEAHCIDKHCAETRASINECLDEYCSSKQALKQFVPLFIRLKDFAETSLQPNLLTYISSLFNIELANLELVLNEGRGLILLDGLDEVREDQKNRVKREIENFINYSNFYKSRFIITCRLAAAEYDFTNFTEVEISEFEDEQIAYFVKGWFDSEENSIQGTKFLQKLNSKESKPIRELAANPLLLTLLCLVFEDSGDFPTQHSDLYRDGLEVLLKKWDAKRSIERAQVYKKLSLKHKEYLLSQLAYSTFIKDNCIFEQEDAEREIADYTSRLCNHPQGNLELDSEAILKSIEAQHGLLTEQAKRLYSFSHLTFHEYFTAKHIVANCDPHSMDSPILKELMQYLTHRSWREVFLLTTEMLVIANSLLKLMKAKIDEMLAEDQELQAFLKWVDEKAKRLSASLGHTHNLAAIRACYLDFDIAIDPERSLGWVLDCDFTRIFTCSSFLARAARCGVYDILKNRSDELPDLTDLPDLDPALAVTFARAETARRVLERVEDPKLRKKLSKLNAEIPLEFGFSSDIDPTIFRNWLKDSGKEWGDQLRRTIVPYYSQGEVWRYDYAESDEPQSSNIHLFSEKQRNLLHQYYHANLLLVVCLKSDCRIDANVQQEIEQSLFLPSQ